MSFPALPCKHKRMLSWPCIPRNSNSTRLTNHAFYHLCDSPSLPRSWYVHESHGNSHFVCFLKLIPFFYFSSYIILIDYVFNSQLLFFSHTSSANRFFSLFLDLQLLLLRASTDSTPWLGVVLSLHALIVVVPTELLLAPTPLVQIEQTLFLVARLFSHSGPFFPTNFFHFRR